MFNPTSGNVRRSFSFKHNRADQVLRETTDVTTAIHRINTVEVRL